MCLDHRDHIYVETILTLKPRTILINKKTTAQSI